MTVSCNYAKFCIIFKTAKIATSCAASMDSMVSIFFAGISYFVIKLKAKSNNQ